MKSTLVKVLCVLLVFSVCLNIYLFVAKHRWESAWVNQLLATDEIEIIFKASKADISFSNIEALAKERFSSGVKIVELTEPYLGRGIDKKAIKINETLLLFKDGIYAGSKANLPNH